MMMMLKMLLLLLQVCVDGVLLVVVA